MSHAGLRPRHHHMSARPTMGRRMVWGLIVAMVMLWAQLPHQPVLAAPIAQASPQALGLGEYGVATAAAGDTLVYTVEIPQAGAYLVTAIDDEAAATFDLTIVDANDEVLYDDIFTTVELALDAGPLTLEFNASAAEALLFVVMGEIGSMSADASQPGRLVTGSAYAEELVTGARYATLTVPRSSVPHRVILYIESGEEDLFYLSVDGDDMGFRALETDTGNLLSFWSMGGSYNVIVEPFERRSTFSLAIFLSPPPIVLTIGEVVDSVIPAGAEDTLFQIVLDSPYNLLSVDLLDEGILDDGILDDAEGLSIDVVDHLYDPSYSEYSFGDPFIDLENVPPGVYYVRVSGSVEAADRPIAILIEGEAGAPIEILSLDEAATGFMDADTEVVYYQVDIPQAGALVAVAIASDTEDTEFDIVVGLRVGDAIWYSFQSGSEDVLTFVAPVAGTYYVGIENSGTEGDYAVAVSAGDLAPEVPTDGAPAFGVIDSSARTLHRIDISEPNQVLTLMLVGPADVDLDLQLSGYNAQGVGTVQEWGYSVGSVETVSTVVAEAGVLEVRVVSYHGEPANYVLIAHTEAVNRIVGLWAIDAAASSEFGEDAYGAIQATGAPDTPVPGDRQTAWASLEPDEGEEILELAYEFPLVPSEINIYETYNPGAIVAVEIYDLDNEEWVTAWEGEPGPVDEELRIFSLELTGVTFATDGVRIFLDTSAVSGWNEIDAVELRGRP